MALIKCKECGAEISTTAENCPNCGYRTAHGRSVSEAKGYLVSWIIAVALIFVGLIMFLSNMEEFFDRADSLEYYKYFSEEEQKGVRNFVIGLILTIAGVVDVCILWYKINDMKTRGDNGFFMEQGGTTSYNIPVAVEWECDRCGTVNSPKATVCVRCGATHGKRVEERIPAWKRVEMMDAQRNEEKEPVLPHKCVSCGATIQIGQAFCGTCGKKQDR